jgi:hypothetical protein
MATSPASPPNASSGQKTQQSPESQLSDKPESPRMLTEFVALVTLLAAVLSVAVTIWNWDVFHTDFVRIVALTGCFIILVTSVRIWRSFQDKELDRGVFIDLISTGTFCICTTVVVMNVFARPQATGYQRPRATISITTPKPPLPGDIPTAIACPQTISGTGSVPRGYLLAIGYRFPGSSTWTFVDSINWQGKHWRSGPVYMAQYPRSGRLVDLIAIIISKQMANYYVNVTKQHIFDANYWDSAGLPPSIIFKTKRQLAELPAPHSNGKSYCWINSKYG